MLKWGRLINFAIKYKMGTVNNFVIKWGRLLIFISISQLVNVYLMYDIKYIFIILEGLS